MSLVSDYDDVGPCTKRRMRRLGSGRRAEPRRTTPELVVNGLSDAELRVARLVGVLVVDNDGIQQFVMSCRIMGLEAEIAAVAHIAMLQPIEGRALPAVLAATSDPEQLARLMTALISEGKRAMAPLEKRNAQCVHSHNDAAANGLDGAAIRQDDVVRIIRIGSSGDAIAGGR